MPRAYIKNIKVGIQFDDRDTVHNKVFFITCRAEKYE
jgi:hypothetical protein